MSGNLINNYLIKLQKYEVLEEFSSKTNSNNLPLYLNNSFNKSLNYSRSLIHSVIP